jgi:hypothetical protein
LVIKKIKLQEPKSCCLLFIYHLAGLYRYQVDIQVILLIPSSSSSSRRVVVRIVVTPDGHNSSTSITYFPSQTAKMQVSVSYALAWRHVSMDVFIEGLSSMIIMRYVGGGEAGLHFIVSMAMYMSLFFTHVADRN